MQIDPAFGPVEVNTGERKRPLAESQGVGAPLVQRAACEDEGGGPIDLSLFQRQLTLASETELTIPSMSLLTELSESFPDEDGDTVIHMAAVNDDLILANLWRGAFQEKFAEQLNAQNLLGQTPLHIAVINNDNSMIKFLARSGAYIQVHDCQGRTPIHLACQNGSISALQNLFYHTDCRFQSLRSAINATEYNGGMNSLLYFIHCHNPVPVSQFKIIDLLLSSGADPNFADPGSGKNIAHYIADQNNVALYKYLQEKYPDQIDWQAPRLDGGQVALVGDEFVFTKPEE